MDDAFAQISAWDSDCGTDSRSMMASWNVVIHVPWLPGSHACSSIQLLLLFLLRRRHHRQMQLSERLLVDRARRVHHGVVAAAGLGEGDDLADIVVVGQEHEQAVD